MTYNLFNNFSVKYNGQSSCFILLLFGLIGKYFNISVARTFSFKLCTVYFWATKWNFNLLLWNPLGWQVLKIWKYVLHQFYFTAKLHFVYTKKFLHQNFAVKMVNLVIYLFIYFYIINFKIMIILIKLKKKYNTLSSEVKRSCCLFA